MKSVIQNLRTSREGFTLPELLTASALAGIVLTSFVAGFLNQRAVFHRKSLEQEMQQQVRLAMRAIQHDIQNAGSGLVMGTRKMPEWFSAPAASLATDIPHIVEGAGGTDELVTAGYTGAPVATLAGDVSAGAFIMKIDVNTETVSPYTPKVGDVLVLGGVEAVTVTSRDPLTSTLLTFRADPLVAGSGVRLDYPKGSDIYLLNVVHYRLSGSGGVSGLVREDSRYAYGADADMRIAEDIVDMQFNRNGELVEVTLTGRTRKAIPGYDDEPDGRPRYTLSTSVQIGNPNPRLLVVAWPKDILMSSTPTPTPAP